MITGDGKDCRLYYNYFIGADFSRGSFRDPADPIGQIGADTKVVNYRFKTLDGNAIVVLDTKYGWGFARPECVTMCDPKTGAPIKTYNDRDKLAKGDLPPF